MTKVEYSDLYKFLVSLGLALIVVSVAIPWLFLREPFDLLTSQQTLAELSPAAMEVWERRQDWIQIIVDWWWVLSLVLFVTGLILITFGFKWWRTNQLLADRKSKVETLRAETEYENLTAGEKVEQVRAELEAHAGRPSSPEGQPHRLERDMVRIMSIQKAVTDKIAQCFGDTHATLINRRIGRNVYDMILQSQSGSEDIVVEIKTYQSPTTRNQILPAVFQAILLAQRYTEETKRIANPVVVYVVGDDFGGNPISIDEVNKIGFNNQNEPKLHVIFCTLDRFVSMPCDSMRNDFMEGEGITRIW